MFLNPDTIVVNFQIGSGMTVADFGAGAGHFVFAMAKIVGPEGRVYSLDIRQEMIEVVNGYARLHRATQVTTVLCNLEEKNGSTLAGESLDFVLCSTTLHQVNNPFMVLKEAFRVLKPTGKIVIIDWEENSVVKPGKLFTEQDAINTLSQCGFVFKEVLADAGDHHYGIIGEKK